MTVADVHQKTMTYRDLAERLGISLDAAKTLGKRRARAGRWDRWTGNDGTTRLRVPLEDLERPGGDPQGRPQDVPQDDPQDRPQAYSGAVDVEGWRSAVSQAEARIADLQAVIERQQADLDRERERSERLEQRADQARQDVEEARHERDDLRAELDRVRADLDAERAKGILARLLGR